VTIPDVNQISLEFLRLFRAGKFGQLNFDRDIVDDYLSV